MERDMFDSYCKHFHCSRRRCKASSLVLPALAMFVLGWILACTEPVKAQSPEKPPAEIGELVPQPHVDPEHRTLESLIDKAGDKPQPGTPGAVQPAPAKEIKRLPIPSSAAQTKILPLVNEVFELESKKLAAAEPKEISELARSILKEALDTTNDPNTQYVMLRKACELAATVGDLPAALQAIDEIGQRFKADTTAMRVIITTTALKTKIPPEARVNVIESALPVVDEAIAADKYDAAGKISSSLLSLAGRVSNKNYTQQIAERRKLIAQKQKAFGKVSAALKAIKVNPNDPEANTTVGTYLCANKNEWDKGLPMLAKGSDTKLKQAALQDRTNPTEPQKQVMVGDSWYNAAEELPDEAKLACLERAKAWYERCLPKLTGLHKVKAQKRVEKIAEVAEELQKKIKPVIKPRFPCNGVIVAACDYRFDIAINGSLVGSGRYAAPVKVARVFNAGDTIIARVRRRTGGKAFSCAIKLEGYPGVLVTGARGSGWMSYRPSTYQWYTPGQGTVVGPAIPAVGASSQAISNLAGVRCGAIWSSADQSPTSSFSYAYLILQVK